MATWRTSKDPSDIRELSETLTVIEGSYLHGFLLGIDDGALAHDYRGWTREYSYPFVKGYARGYAQGETNRRA